jgi:hypothetical protein
MTSDTSEAKDDMIPMKLQRNRTEDEGQRAQEVLLFLITIITANFYGDAYNRRYGRSND